MAMNDVPIPPASPPRPEALTRARAALQAELRRPRGPTWKAGVLRVGAVIVGLSVMVAVAVVMVGATTAAELASRAVTLATLTLVALSAAWAALHPHARAGRWVSLVMVLVSAGVVLVTRGAGAASSQPGWVCAVSQLAVGLPPASVVVVLLRGMAPSPLRSVVAGLSAGSTGAIVGELVCAQSAAHVALFHLTTWGAVGLAVMVLSSTLSPRSYAP
jgi:hypothetical protein